MRLEFHLFFVENAPYDVVVEPKRRFFRDKGLVISDAGEEIDDA